jgi:hypothetical protein
MNWQDPYPAVSRKLFPCIPLFGIPGRAGVNGRETFALHIGGVFD